MYFRYLFSDYVNVLYVIADLVMRIKKKTDKQYMMLEQQSKCQSSLGVVSTKSILTIKVDRRVVFVNNVLNF